LRRKVVGSALVAVRASCLRVFAFALAELVALASAVACSVRVAENVAASIADTGSWIVVGQALIAEFSAAAGVADAYVWVIAVCCSELVAVLVASLSAVSWKRNHVSSAAVAVGADDVAVEAGAGSVACASVGAATTFGIASALILAHVSIVPWLAHALVIAIDARGAGGVARHVVLTSISPVERITLRASPNLLIIG